MNIWFMDALILPTLPIPIGIYNATYVDCRVETEQKFKPNLINGQLSACTDFLLLQTL